MPQKLLTTAVALLALLAATAVGARALMWDQDVLAANAFSTSTIDLTVSPTSALASFAGMVPGDGVTGTIVVTNPAGGGTLRYSVTTSATNADAKNLRDQLRLIVRTGDAGSPSSCASFSGTELHTGPLVLSPFGRVLGNAGQGTHAGDRVLAPGASERLCVRVELPLSTPNSYSSASTTATFHFSAEQTANIP